MSKVTRNRLGNASNGYQGHFKKVLCVCSAGVLRSPTLAEVLSRDPFNFNTRAVGLDQEFALVPIDLVHIAWADEICVMDHEQQAIVEEMIEQLEENHGHGMMHFGNKKIHNLLVPDDFGFRDPTLVKILTQKAYEIFEAGSV